MAISSASRAISAVAELLVYNTLCRWSLRGGGTPTRVSSDVTSRVEFCQVRDLEAELDLEHRRGRDAAAENKKLHKQLADLRTQADDDHRMVAELSDQVTTLQMKIATMKRQLDENVRSHILLCFATLSSSPKTDFVRVRKNSPRSQWRSQKLCVRGQTRAPEPRGWRRRRHRMWVRSGRGVLSPGGLGQSPGHKRIFCIF